MSQPGTTTSVNHRDKNIDAAVNSQNEIANGWWEVSFHRKYNKNEEPAWYLDTLIALQIIKPILDSNPEISLWRFHRRAAEDAAGQSFAFIFLAPGESAEHIYQIIGSSQLTQDLIEQHYIDRVSYYDIHAKLRPNVEDTSDTDWPIELQKSWPYFIMGVSQTWLDLVGQFYQKYQQASVEPALAQQVETFKQVNDAIDQLWESNGGHAFLHHLNALFGYKELYIIQRNHVRF